MHCVNEVMDPWFLGICGSVTIGYQLFFFIIAAAFKFDKVTDLAGGSNFIVLAALTFSLGGSYYLRQLLLTTAVVLWGARLSAYLLIRVLTTGKDDRFDKMDRGFSLKFAGFWVAQAIWVVTVFSPVMLVNATCDQDPPMGSLDVIGLMMFGIGFLIEIMADHQKFMFRLEETNQGKHCDIGLWAYSRHPNYFGEILLWWGIFTSCCPIIALNPWYCWAIVGPVLLTILILFASGIPILERKSDKTYGHSPAYKKWKAGTSPLIPLPRAFYSLVPPILKLIFFFEWPLYTRNEAAKGDYEPVK